jgi:hypothetical protein
VADLDNLLKRLELHSSNNAGPICISSAGAAALVREVKTLRRDVLALGRQTLLAEVESLRADLIRCQRAREERPA